MKRAVKSLSNINRGLTKAETGGGKDKPGDREPIDHASAAPVGV